MAKELLDIKEALEIIKTKIRLVRIDANGEWVFKCPFCGDSENPYHAHLYVSEKNGLINCFKCEAKGNVNRLLKYIDGDNKSRVDIKYDSEYKRKGGVIEETSLRNNVTAFEDYILKNEKILEFNNSFDINLSLTDSAFKDRNDYMEKRIIKDDKARDLIYSTNMQQKLFTYYAEYYMNKLIDKGILSDRMYQFAVKNVIDTNMSVMFLGFNKVLNIFKTTSADTKYLKFKHKLLTGEYSDERDFFMIINRRRYKGISDIYKQEHLNVYFAEGVFDAINLYLYTPSYITGVEPDLVVATGSKVSYASALFFVRDTFMKPVISHCFLDPDINEKKFSEKYRKLRSFYKGFLAYKNLNEVDYGDISRDDLRKIKIA